MKERRQNGPSQKQILEIGDATQDCHLLLEEIRSQLNCTADLCEGFSFYLSQIRKVHHLEAKPSFKERERDYVLDRRQKSENVIYIQCSTYSPSSNLSTNKMWLTLGKMIARQSLNSEQKDTVWKFHEFYITQILREKRFWEHSRAKSAILTHLEALNFDFCEFLHFQKAENYQIDKIQSLKEGKNSNFRTSKFFKIDFT